MRSPIQRLSFQNTTRLAHPHVTAPHLRKTHLLTRRFTLSYPGHHYAADYPHAAAAAMNAGCDQSWDGDLEPDVQFGEWPDGILAQALRANLTTWAAVEQAARNTFVPRFRVGLYDPPGSNPWDAIGIETILSPAHVKLAEIAAVEGHTLLKNEGIFPLIPAGNGGPKVVGVVGAAATSATLSIDRYSGQPTASATSTYLDGPSSHLPHPAQLSTRHWKRRTASVFSLLADDEIDRLLPCLQSSSTVTEAHDAPCVCRDYGARSRCRSERRELPR